MVDSPELRFLDDKPAFLESQADVFLEGSPSNPSARFAAAAA
jgi:hypothetical protein